ncbi:MAG: hypothetical protein PHD44_07980, partial [Halothiobacillus sp.]|nr:hypothetical protein [Halothiobacillus sp.]
LTTATSLKPATTPTASNSARNQPDTLVKIGRCWVVNFRRCLTVGMIWLSLAGTDASYATDIALPMVLIGLGNGGALGPLTIAGVSGVAPRDHGAASGLVNAAHQLGGSLGLGILVVAFAAAKVPGIAGAALLNQQIDAAIEGGGIMLSLALLITLIFVIPSERARLQPICCDRCD